MANVTDMDLDLARSWYFDSREAGAASAELAARFAAYRERIEARKDAEWRNGVVARDAHISAQGKRIAELEAQLPKAPPSDSELIEMLEKAIDDYGNPVLIKSVRDALRARGGK